MVGVDVTVAVGVGVMIEIAPLTDTEGSVVTNAYGKSVRAIFEIRTCWIRP